jgi:hypothetical protein
MKPNNATGMSPKTGTFRIAEKSLWATLWQPSPSPNAEQRVEDSPKYSLINRKDKTSPTKETAIPIIENNLCFFIVFSTLSSLAFYTKKIIVGK